MAPEHPTYRLGPDFDRKLTAFVQAMVSSGWEIFGKEFERVDEFVVNAKLDSRERDDHQLRRSDKSLYLLEAISYKLCDELNREAFNHTHDTLIIMPDCLSLHNPDCLKEDQKWGDVCLQCTPDCQANEIIQLAARYNATVVFSKRKLEEQLKHYADKSTNLGVVGVACLLMLANGMRTAMEMGIPVRGIPLDFTGCEHWNEQPFASVFPLSRLESILKEKHEHRH
jgi:hypothetical protein